MAKARKAAKGSAADPRLARFLAAYPNTVPPFDTDAACRDAEILWVEVQGAIRTDEDFKASFGALEAQKLRMVEDKLAHAAILSGDRAAMAAYLGAHHDAYRKRPNGETGGARDILDALLATADTKWSERFPEVVTVEATTTIQ